MKTMITTADYPTYEHVMDVCKVGMGSLCCRYLTMSGGWSCEKKSGMKAYFDRRVAEKAMNARGDNCPGKDSRAR